MFKIIVECDRGEDFGVLVWSTRVEDYAVSRQIGSPATFETKGEAEYQIKRFLRHEGANQFSFRVEEIS
jgi:hypothetical protein